MEGRSLGRGMRKTTAPFVHMLDLQYCGTSRYPAGNQTRSQNFPERKGLTHSGLSVFTGVIVYEVTANTEFVNSAEMQAQVPTSPWSPHFHPLTCTSPGCIIFLFEDSLLDNLGFNPWVGKILWRREWQPTPLFLPGEFHGQRSLVCYSPWGCKESDNSATNTHTHYLIDS